jgi:adenine deaminase
MTKNLSTTLGKQKAELVFKNAKVVNVFTKEIITTDVAVNGEVIVGTNNKYSGLKEIDCKGKYLVPGLIDPHIHLCSSLTTPRNFMSVATNHGVCTVIADPHEITNVYGHEGLKYYMSDARLAVGNIYFALPSCVPASDYEEANVVFKVDDLARYINLPEVVALGEMMNINGVLDGNKDVLAKIELFKKHHKVIDGHSPLLTKHQLQAYISTGITTNHEATHYWEIKEHLQNGIYIFLRHASYAFVADQELVKLFRSGMSLNRCC